MSLRVQITLLSVPRAAAIGVDRPTACTITASGRRISATFTPSAPLLPGGSAAHGRLQLEELEDVGVLPPGTQFELWKDGRIGYGSVLGWC